MKTCALCSGGGPVTNSGAFGGDNGAKPADVLVIFGITGDLAKVMTFRSLYRLEARNLLEVPIVGLAVDDWTVDQLKQRARESITDSGEWLDEDVFNRLSRRLSYVQGDFWRCCDLGARRRGDQGQGVTWRYLSPRTSMPSEAGAPQVARPPACSVREPALPIEAA